MAFSVKLDTSEVVATLETLHSGLSNLQDLHEILVIEGQKYVFKHWPKGPALAPLTLAARIRGGSSVLQDTGILRNSITGANPSAIATGGNTLNQATKSQSVIGTSIPWATTHNFGAVIVPTRAKALAVPATPEASRARSPRNFPKKLFFVPAKGQKSVGVLVEYTGKKPKGGKRPMKVHYILMKSVTIPARRFMPTAEQFMPVASKAAGAYLAYLTNRKGA